MNKIKTLVSSLVLVGLLALTACRATLEPGGAYAPLPTTNAVTGVVTPANAPDMMFYTIDASYAAVYAAINGLFEFEEANRVALFQLNPEIKHSLDRIRPQAWAYNVSYHRARKAYRDVPVPANLTAMQQMLARMNAVLAAARAILPNQPGNESVTLTLPQ